MVSFIHLFIVLVVIIQSSTGVQSQQTVSIVNWNSTIDCTSPQTFTCNFNNNESWIGGLVPGVNQTAVIDYSNQTTSMQSTQYIFINSNLTIVSLQVIGDKSESINLALQPSDNYTLAVNVTQSLELVSSAILLNDTNVVVAGAVTLGRMGVLHVGKSSTLYTQSFNGSSSGSVLVLGMFSDVDVQSTGSVVTAVSGFSVESFTSANNATLVVGGVVFIGEAQTKGMIELIGNSSTAACTVGIGANSNVMQLVSSASANTSVFITLEDGTMIGNLSIGQQSSIEINGVVTVESSVLLNNTDILINTQSQLVLNGPTNLGETGGINVEGDFAITHPLQLGSVGLVVRGSNTNVMLANTQIQGNIYHENGTITANQTQITNGCYSHSDGVLYIQAQGNQIVISCYQQTQTTAQLWMANIQDQNTSPYILAESVDLRGQLLFSVQDDALTPTFSSKLISTGTIVGQFSVTDALNGEISKKDYAINTVQVSEQVYNVEIDFSKENTKPKAPLWKIFLIIIGAIGGLFIFSYFLIKLTRYIKARRAASSSTDGNINNNYQYSQL